MRCFLPTYLSREAYVGKNSILSIQLENSSRQIKSGRRSAGETNKVVFLHGILAARDCCSVIIYST